MTCVRELLAIKDAMESNSRIYQVANERLRNACYSHEDSSFQMVQAYADRPRQLSTNTSRAIQELARELDTKARWSSAEQCVALINETQRDRVVEDAYVCSTKFSSDPVDCLQALANKRRFEISHTACPELQCSPSIHQ